MMLIGDMYGRDRVFICTVAFGPSDEDYEVLEKMSKVLPNSSFQKLGLSSNCLRTAFSSLTSTVTSLCSEFAGATLTTRAVEKDTMDGAAQRAESIDLTSLEWDFYPVLRSGGEQRRGDNMTVQGKYKWDFANKLLQPHAIAADVDRLFERLQE
eukprot:295371-Hanusia_phi.AAC.1